MRLNGGIIGANNRPTNRSAGGIWKWSEQQTHVGYNTFPMFIDGYNFTKIQNAQTKYTGRYVTVGAQDGNPSGLYFKPDDGTKMYMIGGTTNVHQYTLSTGWNANTATYDNIKFSIVAQTTSPTGVFFKPTGDKMYICNDLTEIIHQYSLSTSWNVATASYDNKSFSIASQDSSLRSIHLKPDGYKFWALGATNDRVFQYSIGTQWDISTATYDNISYYIGTQELGSSGLFFKDDGTIMYVSGDSSANIFQYSLGTAWNVATAVYSNNLFNPYHATQLQSISNIQDLYVKSDRIYCVFGSSGSADFVGEYALDNWEIKRNPGYIESLDVSAQVTSGAQDLFFKSDGKELYIIDSTSDNVIQYSLSSGYNLSTATYTRRISIASQESSGKAVFFKPDGTKMYVVGSSSDSVYQYSLATPWNISTASYDSKSFSISAQEITVEGMFFKPDGTIMYVMGQTADTVFQYNLATAWDITTASYANKSFNIASNSFANGETAPICMVLSQDGSVMFVGGSITKKIYRYRLSSSWDISTASYFGEYYGVEDVLGQNGTASNITGLHFKADGTKMFMLSSSGQQIHAFSLIP